MLKSISNLLAVGMLSSLALAQSATPAPANQTAVNPAPKTTTAAKTKAAPKPATPAKSTTASKPSTAPKSSTAKKTAPVPAVKPAAKPVAKKPAPAAAAKPVAKKPEVKKPAVKVAEKPKPSPAKTPAADEKVKTVALDPHRRDPFVNPLQLQEDKMRNTAACTTGARCLMIDQVVLKGVVKTQAGMIAMVENSAKKQYNLREKDPVYNGFVLKITGDTVVFKETTVDTLGKSTSKEVVKRVTVPAV
jgi:Tfp pilus assembly protein PilP